MGLQSQADCRKTWNHELERCVFTPMWCWVSHSWVPRGAGPSRHPWQPGSIVQVRSHCVESRRPVSMREDGLTDQLKHAWTVADCFMKHHGIIYKSLSAIIECCMIIISNWKTTEYDLLKLCVFMVYFV